LIVTWNSGRTGEQTQAIPLVGITRAKRDLIVTWNSGRTGEQTQAIPFAALQGWWESSGQ